MRAPPLLPLLALALILGCAPQSSGPPVSEAGGPETAALPSGHPTVVALQEPQGMPSGHPSVLPQQAMTQNPREIRQTQGTVVSVAPGELILALPSGSQLRFHMADELAVQPSGLPASQLKGGEKVRVRIRHLDQGMQAESIEVL